ncbi:MAG: hypothetical protein ACI9EK_001544 [Psychroserpens sp.]|jgi:hypothetical protein
MQQISVVRLSYSDFNSIEYTWSHLLENSEANSLFSSWVWQKTWWDVWQPRLDLHLLLLGVYESGTLIGIVPCYTYIIKKKIGFSITRCEYIGNYSHGDDSIRSEYLNFILPKERYEELIPLIIEFIKKQSVHEMVFTDVDMGSSTGQYFDKLMRNVFRSKENGIRIPTNKSFNNYLAGLGKNTRLKLYNRRKVLVTPDIIKISVQSELSMFFDNLNSMHLTRWGKPCFSAHSLIFHQKVAGSFLKKGSLSALILFEDGIPIAVCYDITVNNTRYNIQLGFSSCVSNKVSVGTLMLGYAIEWAHEEPLVEYYDLLAGKGKNTFYKSKFHGEIKTFITFLIPITYCLKAKYWLKALIKTTMKK